MGSTKLPPSGLPKDTSLDYVVCGCTLAVVFRRSRGGITPRRLCFYPHKQILLALCLTQQFVACINISTHSSSCTAAGAAAAGRGSRQLRRQSRLECETATTMDDIARGKESKLTADTGTLEKCCAASFSVAVRSRREPRRRTTSWWEHSSYLPSIPTVCSRARWHAPVGGMQQLVDKCTLDQTRERGV